MSELTTILERGHLRTVFQPIVDLDLDRVVAYEALTRGPEGSPLERPDRLFAAARVEHLVEELDERCVRAALDRAAELGFDPSIALFVNTEPRGLRWRRATVASRSTATVIVELTERALLSRPSELLQTVAEARERGWGVALDDVGAEPTSLALLPIVQPDVVKLDLRLVQQRPTREMAAIATAVQAEAERSGMRILAEGVETERHLELARSLGASLAQGWYFGRPEPAPERASDPLPGGSVRLLRGDTRPAPSRTPAQLLHPHHQLRRATKPLLLQMSKHLEDQAAQAGETAIVLGTFQHARYFTGASERRYRDLADRAAFVGAFGVDMPVEPTAGVRGGLLHAGDALEGEWDLVVVSAHFAGALVAVDLGDTGAERDRRFDYLVTYDRDIVEDLARSLLVRIFPDLRASGGSRRPERQQAHVPGWPRRDRGSAPQAVTAGSPTLRPGAALDPSVLLRAVEATRSGLTIADVRLPDQPLVHVNQGFERLTGYPAAEVLGRNCRILQGPGTDPAAIDKLRAAIRDERATTVRLLNYRRDGSPWWNEVHLSPLHDESGRLTHLVGIQHDVTAEVEAQAQLAHLSRHDPLTGLRNRTALYRDLEALLVEPTCSTSVLYLDLVGFKSVNDRLGHATGDEVLRRVAAAMWSVLDATARAYRIGGDEFVVVLSTTNSDDEVAARVATQLAAAIASPISMAEDEPVQVAADVGWAHAREGESVESVLRRADADLYDRRRAARAHAPDAQPRRSSSAPSGAPDDGSPVGNASTWTTTGTASPTSAPGP
jgi:diguanylate cyclase (GGDEF)-like protein/PAS domain S-box-containing protein